MCIKIQTILFQAGIEMVSWAVLRTTVITHAGAWEQVNSDPALMLQ